MNDERLRGSKCSITLPAARRYYLKWLTHPIYLTLPLYHLIVPSASFNSSTMSSSDDNYSSGAGEQDDDLDDPEFRNIVSGKRRRNPVKSATAVAVAAGGLKKKKKSAIATEITGTDSPSNSPNPSTGHSGKKTVGGGNKKKRRTIVNSSGSEDSAALSRREDVSSSSDGDDNNNDSDDDDEFGQGSTFASASGFLGRLLGSNREAGKPVKDLGGLALKVDHASRPLWIDNRGKM